MLIYTYTILYTILNLYLFIHLLNLSKHMLNSYHLCHIMAHLQTASQVISAAASGLHQQDHPQDAGQGWRDVASLTQRLSSLTHHLK